MGTKDRIVKSSVNKLNEKIAKIHEDYKKVIEDLSAQVSATQQAHNMEMVEQLKKHTQLLAMTQTRARLADMAVSAALEVLISKGLMTVEEFQQKLEVLSGENKDEK